MSVSFIRRFKFELTEALEQGSLAQEFTEGKIKLVPIVFSHGMRASRTMY